MWRVTDGEKKGGGGQDIGMRGSEYGVTESAKGGGLWVREELKECWDDRV